MCGTPIVNVQFLEESIGKAFVLSNVLFSHQWLVLIINCLFSDPALQKCHNSQSLFNLLLLQFRNGCHQQVVLVAIAIK